MTNILLIGEDFVKTHSGLNENVWGAYLAPAIRDAQDIKLQSILGSNLYKTILQMVDVEMVTDQYLTLLEDYIQIYLMYQTLSDLVPIIGVKLSNLGVVVSNDEHITNLSQSERELVQNSFMYKADFYAKRMQEYLLENRNLFPELDDCTCNTIKSNLDSSASTGLWLGGMRGRRL